MEGVGLRVKGSGFTGECLGGRVQGLGFRVWGLAWKVEISRFRV